MLSNKCFIIKQ